MLTAQSWFIESTSVLFDPWPLPKSAAVTETVTSTTATVVPTSVPPAGAIPVNAPVPPPPWESGNWLVDTGWATPYHVPLLVLFVVLGVAALVLYFYFSRRRYAGHVLNAHLAEFLAGVLGAASIVGLLLLLCAYLTIPFLSMPVWPLILVLTLLGFAGFSIWYYWQRYPTRLAAYEREAVKQRYMPTGRERTKKTTPSKLAKPVPPGQRRRKKKRRRR